MTPAFLTAATLPATVLICYWHMSNGLTCPDVLQHPTQGRAQSFGVWNSLRSGLQGLPQAVPRNTVWTALIFFKMCAMQPGTSKVVISQMRFRTDCCHLCRWYAKQILASPLRGIMSKGPRVGEKSITDLESEALLGYLNTA